MQCRRQEFCNAGLGPTAHTQLVSISPGQTSSGPDQAEWGGWGSNPRPADYEAIRHLDAYTAAELLKDRWGRWGSNPRPANYEASQHLDAAATGELQKDQHMHSRRDPPGRAFAMIKLADSQSTAISHGAP
jgi:hypothetical protein